VQLIDGSFLRRHKHLPCALVELLKIANTSSGADGVLHHPPEAFDGVEVVPTMSWEEMAAQLPVVMVEGRVELVRPMDPAAIDDHPHLCAGVAAGRQHLVPLVAPLLGSKMRHDFSADFGGPIVDGADDAA
jgi:hypothetical protein